MKQIKLQSHYIFDCTLHASGTQRMTLSDFHPSKQQLMINHLIKINAIEDVTIANTKWTDICDDLWKTIFKFLNFESILTGIDRTSKYFNKLSNENNNNNNKKSNYWKDLCIKLFPSIEVTHPCNGIYDALNNNANNNNSNNTYEWRILFHKLCNFLVSFGYFTKNQIIYRVISGKIREDQSIAFLEYCMPIANYRNNNNITQDMNILLAACYHGDLDIFRVLFSNALLYPSINGKFEYCPIIDFVNQDTYCRLENLNNTDNYRNCIINLSDSMLIFMKDDIHRHKYLKFDIFNCCCILGRIEIINYLLSTIDISNNNHNHKNNNNNDNNNNNTKSRFPNLDISQSRYNGLLDESYQLQWQACINSYSNIRYNNGITPLYNWRKRFLVNDMRYDNKYFDIFCLCSKTNLECVCIHTLAFMQLQQNNNNITNNNNNNNNVCEIWFDTIEKMIKHSSMPVKNISRPILSFMNCNDYNDNYHNDMLKDQLNITLLLIKLYPNIFGNINDMNNMQFCQIQVNLRNNAKMIQQFVSKTINDMRNEIDASVLLAQQFARQYLQ